MKNWLPAPEFARFQTGCAVRTRWTPASGWSSERELHRAVWRCGAARLVEWRCHDLQARYPVEITLLSHPGAYHDFDAPDRPVKIRGGAATVPGGFVHVGTSAPAREDAAARVPRVPRVVGGNTISICWEVSTSAKLHRDSGLSSGQFARLAF